MTFTVYFFFKECILSMIKYFLILTMNNNTPISKSVKNQTHLMLMKVIWTGKLKMR